MTGSQQGIQIKGGTYPTVRGSTVTGTTNAIGIKLTGASPILDDNTATGNALGDLRVD